MSAGAWDLPSDDEGEHVDAEIEHMSMRARKGISLMAGTVEPAVFGRDDSPNDDESFTTSSSDAEKSSESDNEWDPNSGMGALPADDDSHPTTRDDSNSLPPDDGIPDEDEVAIHVGPGAYLLDAVKTGASTDEYLGSDESPSPIRRYNFDFEATSYSTENSSRTPLEADAPDLPEFDHGVGLSARGGAERPSAMSDDVTATRRFDEVWSGDAAGVRDMIDQNEDELTELTHDREEDSPSASRILLGGMFSQSDVGRIRTFLYYTICFFVVWFGPAYFDQDGDGDFDQADVDKFMQSLGFKMPQAAVKRQVVKLERARSFELQHKTLGKALEESQLQRSSTANSNSPQLQRSPTELLKAVECDEDQVRVAMTKLETIVTHRHTKGARRHLRKIMKECRRHPEVKL
jgi:hypothetical protein